MLPALDIKELIKQRFKRSVSVKLGKPIKSASNIVRTESVDLREYRDYKKNGRAVATTKMREATPVNHTIHQRVSLFKTQEKDRDSPFDISRIFMSKKSMILQNGTTQIYKVDVDNEQRSYALKIVQIDGNQTERELYFLKKLNHPNIIELKHYFITKSHNERYNLHLIFPFISHNLKFFLDKFPQRPTNDKKQSGLPKILLKLMIYQLVRAVAYLHMRKVMHRDIHPGNILFDPDTLELKVIDFSSAKQIVRGEKNAFYIGSRDYRAPELLLGAEVYDEGVDLWQMGCIMVEIYHGIKLFKGRNSNEVMASIIKTIGIPSLEQMKSMNSPISDLRLPQFQPETFTQRFSKYKYQDGFSDLIEKILRYDNRMNAFDALGHSFFNELKLPNVRINKTQLPNLFNFTDEEREHYHDHLYKLVPEWYKTKEKRDKYLQTSFEDALLVLKM